MILCCTIVERMKKFPCLALIVCLLIHWKVEASPLLINREFPNFAAKKIKITTKNYLGLKREVFDAYGKKIENSEYSSSGLSCLERRSICDQLCQSFNPETLKCSNTVERCEDICVRFGRNLDQLEP